MSDKSGPVLWDAARLDTPHAQEDKAARVRKMFDRIAPTYELVNRVASVGRDRFWREEMVRLAAVRPGDVLLDVACGTGDVARTFAGVAVRPARIVGLDFSLPMLALAAGRPVERGSFVRGDALHLPLVDESVSLVTCAFGIRNFQDLGAGLEEMYRVLRPGGRAVILEFTIPESRLLRRLYLLYFQRLLPLLAGIISRDRSGAYRYLPRSVVSFAGRDDICARLAAAGFTSVTAYPLSWGIVAVYAGLKRSPDGRAS